MFNIYDPLKTYVAFVSTRSDISDTHSIYLLKENLGSVHVLHVLSLSSQ